MTMQMHFKKTQKAWSTLGLLGFCLLVQAPAYADDVEDRVIRMEQDLQTLSKAVYGGGGSGYSGGGSTSSTDTEVRLQQLEADIRELRGKVEEQTFEVRQLRDQLTRATGDIEMRLSDIEAGKSGGASGASAAAGGSVSGASAATPASSEDQPPYPQSSNGGGGSFQWGTNNGASATGGQLGSYGEKSGGGDTAADLYEDAFSLLKNNNYDQAQAGFQKFMDSYPEHELAGNAKYWLGETYYVRGKYDQSARIFAEGYQKYPKSAKAADNLLKLGLSLDALGKKGDACIAFKQLKKENMTGAAPVMRRADQEMARLGCE